MSLSNAYKIALKPQKQKNIGKGKTIEIIINLDHYQFRVVHRIMYYQVAERWLFFYSYFLKL